MYDEGRRTLCVPDLATLQAFLPGRSLLRGLMARLPGKHPGVADFIRAYDGCSTWLYLPPVYSLWPRPLPVSWRPSMSAPLRVVTAPVAAGIALDQGPAPMAAVSLQLCLFEDHMTFKFTPKLCRLVARALPPDELDGRRLVIMGGAVSIRGMHAYRHGWLCPDDDWDVFELPHGGCTAMLLGHGSIARQHSGGAELWTALAAAATRAGHAARAIQRAWRLAISCPRYEMCRLRLLTEFGEMDEMTRPSA